MKVFLVNDTDGEGDAYYAASTHGNAWSWIKNKQMEDIEIHRKRGWTKAQLEGFVNHYADPEELHPYDIQEIEIDEAY